MYFQNCCFILHGMKRQYQQLIHEYLGYFPCVVLIGARQIGKSTLIQMFSDDREIFDLELRADYNYIANDPNLWPGELASLKLHSSAFLKQTRLILPIFSICLKRIAQLMISCNWLIQPGMILTRQLTDIGLKVAIQNPGCLTREGSERFGMNNI